METFNTLDLFGAVFSAISETKTTMELPTYGSTPTGKPRETEPVNTDNGHFILTRIAYSLGTKYSLRRKGEKVFARAEREREGKGVLPLSLTLHARVLRLVLTNNFPPFPHLSAPARRLHKVNLVAMDSG